MKPTLICRPDLAPEALGIDSQSVDLVTCDSPLLRDLVILDCPDPDTTEAEDQHGTNLARLRELLPHCDVLLVTSTQQKYRSARVSEELQQAATGARLVFVQTHADSDDDIREDWRRQLSADYQTGRLYFVDSLAALDDARAGLAPRGDFGRLVDLLTRELAGAAAHRIRRANFLDLVEETLAACKRKIDAGLPQVEALEQELERQRLELSRRLAGEMQTELINSRRHWENRLLGEVASRWGFSPFSVVLRAFQGLGGALTGALLMRVRSPAQLALWGALEGGRRLRSRRNRKVADKSLTNAVNWSWDEAQMREAALVVEGYAREAGFSRADISYEAVTEQAAAAGAQFVETAGAQLQALISQQASRHTGWFTRWRYELALLAVLVLVLYRLGRNFFWDSWLAPELGYTTSPKPVLGFDFFLQSAFWVVLWSGLLLWLFTWRLRRGLRGEIVSLANRWSGSSLAPSLFAPLERQARAAERFADDHQRLESSVTALRSRLSEPQPRLGRRIA